MITLSINLLDLDKARFKTVTKRNGKVATYCDLVMIETPNGEYGDFIVKQSVTKEERAARKEMPILGNGKIFHSTRGGAPVAAAGEDEPPKDDDVPF